jgi:phenylacetic acid degradation operon negative regulatory protein
MSDQTAPHNAQLPHEIGRLSARELILALIDSSSAETLTASYLITAGRLFDMDPGSVRVAVARLVKESALVTAGRGLYRRGNRAGALHSLVRGWANVETALKPWSGNWLVALLSHLNRGDRKRLRGWERALRLFGFADNGDGFWLRPANFVAELDELRTRMLELGLSEEVPLLDVAELASTEPLQPDRLWPVARLEDDYRANLRLLEASTGRLGEFDEDTAARETLLIGRAVTRDILLDPLLPEALIDTRLRGEVIHAMKDYDRTGKRLWRDFYRRHRGAITAQTG